MNLQTLNKNDLLIFTEKILAENEALKSTPLSAAAIERMQLSLEKEIIAIKERMELAKINHEKALAEMQANHEKTLKELELKYSSNTGTELLDFAEKLKELEEKAAKAKDSLAFKLKEAEVEANAKLAELEEKVSKKDTDVYEALVKLDENLDNAKKDFKAKMETLTRINEREVEELEYNHKLAIRDSKLDVAKKICDASGLSIVNEKEYSDLVAFKAKSEADFAAILKSETGKAHAMGKAAGESTSKEELTKAQNTIALLENDKKYLLEGNAALRLQLADLTEQVKSIPAQIASAVEAAKVNVSVDNKSK